MKYWVAGICLSVLGVANAQSTDQKIEFYERYENGELVEQRKSATENGKPIENFDFEEVKRKMVLKSAELDVKMKEMETRFEERLTQMSFDMDERKQAMEQRMADFEKRSEEFHKRMDQRMKEEELRREKDEETPPKQTPFPVEKSVEGVQTGSLKFT